MSAHVKPKGVDKTQKKGINSLSHKNQITIGNARPFRCSPQIDFLELYP
jgi:hypothetical protein